MENSILMEKAAKPTNASLADALGQSYRYYLELRNLTKNFRADWQFSKLSGWMLKVSDAKKALFYLIPLHGVFRINLTLREKERESLLLNPIARGSHTAMQNSKKYAEGFLMQFLISDQQSFAHCNAFLNELIKLR